MSGAPSATPVRDWEAPGPRIRFRYLPSRLFFFPVSQFSLSSVLPFPVVALRFGQPLPDQIDLPFGRGDAPFRFLLESMQDIDGDLQHRAASGPLERLGRRVHVAFLRRVERLANIAPYLAWKGFQIPARRSNPNGPAS